VGVRRLEGAKDVWPAILVTGVSFAIPQFVISNYINPGLSISTSLVSMGCLILFLVWQPNSGCRRHCAATMSRRHHDGEADGQDLAHPKELWNALPWSSSAS
jgi:L-lactate permease